MASIRPAAVAGSFYPADPKALTRDLERLLSGVSQPGAPPRRPPKVLVVPHAGYAYSGPVAAHAYAELAAARGSVRRVVLLGPVHRVPMKGLALPASEAFATPLGAVALDRDAIRAVQSLPQVVSNEAAHALEHSLEVQLPFLQQTLGEFGLVPFAVGTASVAQVGEVIERLWGGAETVFVVSTDLSHYCGYELAKRMDAATIARIGCYATDIAHEEACGATPLNGMLEVAKRRALALRLLAACNSGDTAGGKEQVVGYSAFALYEGGDVASNDTGEAVISVARGSIAHGLGLAPSAPDVATPAWLTRAGASFVTLMLQGKLRGCIGSLEAARPIGADVAANALAAAFRDPRFSPLSAAEWPLCCVEVSLLSAPTRVRFADEEELLARLVPGKDGVILEAGSCRATFLPQVWESLPDPRSFLAELKRKAGLPADHRLVRCAVSSYRVMKWRQAEIH
jgi:MEMO1 family protein